MRGESSVPNSEPSTFRGRKYAPKKIRPVDEGISFRDLAKFAARRKTIEFLCERTDCDPSTAKRWLSGESRAPAHVLREIVVDVLSRVEL